MDRLLHIDRRWIFALIFLAVLVPFLLNLKLIPGTASPATTDVYNFISKLPKRAVVMISFDYGPASMPELQPMAVALCRQSLARGLRVVAVTLHPQGFIMADKALAVAAAGTDAKYGRDYVNLGFKPGYTAVILNMGSSIPGVYAQDVKGNPVGTLPVMQGVRDYSDVALLVPLSSASTPGAWIAYAHEKYKVPMAVGITAVMATDFYPYYQAKQVVGLLNGLKGAAEYEHLIDHPDMGALGMASQSIAHVVIILFVILGNVGYLASRRLRRR